MATLSVFKFNNTDGADRALGILKQLQKQQLIDIMDDAVVSWPPERKGPKVRQAVDTTAASALSGGFWGLLLGLIFFMPLLGFAYGAVAGALGGALSEVGIDDYFISKTRGKVTPGTSALFLMSKNAVADQVIAELKDTNPEIISTNLPADKENRLRELFAA